MWMYIIEIPKQHGSYKLICLAVLSSGKWGTETSRADSEHKTFTDCTQK